MRQIIIILSIIFSFTVSSCSGEKEESTTDTTIPTPIESAPYDDTSTDGDNTTITSPTPDTTAPTVTSVSTISDNQSRVSITDNITLTFSEVMNTDYVRTNTSDTNCSGTLRVSSDNFTTCIKISSYPSSSNLNKTFTLDPYDNFSYSTTYKIRVTTGVKDKAGNALSNQYETPNGFTTPITVNTFTLSDTALKSGENTTVTLDFSEEVASFSSSADITVANGALATMSSSDNKTWTGTFTPTADTEDASNTLSLATSYTDTDGNLGPAQTTANYEVETLAPSVSSFTLSDTALKSGDNATVTLVFSENVASFSSSADITVANGTLATMTSTDNKTWTGTFTPTTNTEDASNTLSLATSYTDTAGNAGPTQTTANYEVDTLAPSVSSIEISSATGIQNKLLNAGDVVSVTSTFSETVTVTGTPQLTLVVGSTDRTATYHSGSGGTTLVFKYTIQAVETDDDGISIGANILVLNSGTIQDPAGNNATLTHSAVSANSSYKVDTTVPTLAETTSVPSLTNDNSTQYIFSSSEGGTISIGGSCSSDNSTAVADNMTVSFADLEDGTYSNCSITVADSAGNTQTITVNSFTIDTSAPTLSQVTAVTSPTNDNTSSYTFSSTEAGSITYGGSCSSSTTASTTDNNTINFNALADETYSNCKISVTDNASNTSNNLSVNTFTIDTVKPVLEQVTAVTTPTKDPTPGYAFSSDEAGTISYGGSSCSPGGTSAINGTNSISFGTLSEASYSCTITVTDSAENASSELSVNTFVIDTTAPTVSSISSSTSDGVYKSNDNITVTVSFNENVIVDNSSGNPRIQLETGTNDRYASYISGNSTNILSFLYTVQSGDNSSDLDYKSTDSLSANSGTIRDDATNDTTLTLFSPNQSGSLSANKAIVIDGIAPAVSSISPTNNQSGVSITDNISVTFSESMDSSSVTTNSSNTSCSGSFQLSSDNFISCLQMSSSPSSSNSEKTFTVDPSDNLSYSTTYLTRVTTGAKDSNGNTLSSQYESTNGFKTSVTFVIVGDSGLILSSSDNGATWDNMTSGVSTNLASVAYGGGTFVVGGNSGVILTSTNASTWISETSGGNSWSAVSDGVSDNLSGTAYGNDLHVISGVSGTILTSSDNGSSWTSQTSGTSEVIWDVTYYNNIFVSVSDNGLIYTSGDGTTWTSRTSGTSSPLRGVTYGNSTFVAVGNAGKIYTSPDGTTWTSSTSGTSNAFQQVVYGNSTFVAVGSSGTIYTSGDGTTWTSRTSGSSNALQQVAYGNNTFVVISNNGEIFTSADGTTWTLEWTSGTTSLNGITFTE